MFGFGVSTLMCKRDLPHTHAKACVRARPGTLSLNQRGTMKNKNNKRKKPSSSSADQDDNPAPPPTPKSKSRLVREMSNGTHARVAGMGGLNLMHKRLSPPAPVLAHDGTHTHAHMRTCARTHTRTCAHAHECNAK